jgi:hypothetical protein
LPPVSASSDLLIPLWESSWSPPVGLWLDGGSSWVAFDTRLEFPLRLLELDRFDELEPLERRLVACFRSAIGDLLPCLRILSLMVDYPRGTPAKQGRGTVGGMNQASLDPRTDCSRHARVVEYLGKESDQGGQSGPDETKRITTEGVFDESHVPLE